MLSRGWRQLGDLFRFRLGPRQFVLFTGPEAHDAFFSAPDDQLDAKSVYQFTVPIFGRGVAYDVAPEVMAEQLGFLYPALQDAAMQRSVRFMFDNGQLLAGLQGEVDGLVAEASQSSAAAEDRYEQTASNGRIALLVIAVVGILGTLLVAGYKRVSVRQDETR